MRMREVSASLLSHRRGQIVVSPAWLGQGDLAGALGRQKRFETIRNKCSFPCRSLFGGQSEVALDRGVWARGLDRLRDVVGLQSLWQSTSTPCL